MKINKVAKDEVTINTPLMDFKKNILINSCFPHRHSRYKIRKNIKLSKSRYHMKR